MIARKKEGATLGLIPCVLLVLALIGITFFYLTQFFGGSKQLINGTDSGALGAARQLLTVGLQSTEVGNLPIEFQALGVNSAGAPIGFNTSTNTFDTGSAIYNVYAFNRAAGYTLLVALNAAEDGSSTSQSNANTLISDLNTFGTELNSDLANSTQLASVFNSLATSNNPSMLGNKSQISLSNSGIQFASVPGEGIGQANIYFNSAVYANDAKMAGWIAKTVSGSGITSQVNSRYNQNEPSAQSGQPFVLGYSGLDISAITGVSGFTPKIYACAVNPSQMPHMIDSGRFNNNGVSSTCYAPSNSISAQGQATARHPGSGFVPTTNILCTALACAMLGAYDNQYPVDMPFGWIRIKNGQDAVAANPGYGPLPMRGENGDTIYNDQLYPGPGGGGGIYTANADANQHNVFCTENYQNETDIMDPGPSGYSGLTEMNAWLAYNNTPCTGSCQPDSNGHNPELNPNVLASNGLYGSTLSYQSPTPNMRYSGYFGVVASVTNMLSVTSIIDTCTDDNFASDTTCQANVQWEVGNYFENQSLMNANDLDDFGTQAYGGITDVEAVKAKIIQTLDTLWQQTGSESNPTFFGSIASVTWPTNPSGSHVYDTSGNTNYSTPASVDTVAFGTVGTPYQLINQLNTDTPDTLYVNSSTTGTTTTCADTSATSSQWTDVSTPLGALLQRCQMICPTTTSTQLVTLLQTSKLDLNQYQYIYLPIGTSSLTISTTPPSFLQQFVEYNSPGSTTPDGTTVLSCQDSQWGATGNGHASTNVIGSLVDTGYVLGPNGTTIQVTGDDATQGWPFKDWSGSLSTRDGMSWTPSSGRYFFLGQLSFNNYTSGEASPGGTGISLSSPN